MSTAEEKRLMDEFLAQTDMTGYDTDGDAERYMQGDYGYIPRDFKAHPVGSLPAFAKFPENLRIPMKEWPEIIDEQEAKEATMEHMGDRYGITNLEQNPLPYCSAFSGCYCYLYARMIAGLPPKQFSPSSVGGPVTGYRKQGMHIYDVLRYSAEHGWTELSLYPLVTSKNKHNDATRKNAMQNRTLESFDIDARDFEAEGSLLLQYFPIGAGHDWWRHAIMHARLIKRQVNGVWRYGIRHRQTWYPKWQGGGSGKDGWGVLWQSGRGRTGDAVPDQLYAVRVASPS